MPARRPALLCTPFAALFWLALPDGAAAQAATPPAESRITQVKVYPGSATVERVARVAAGSRTLTFACLPAGLDVQSLQVSADASVRLGETAVLTEQRSLSPRCSAGALDGRIRELEERKDALLAEREALGLVTGYLKGVSGPGDDPAGKRVALDPRHVTGVAEALRRTGQDALLKQRQLARRQGDLDRQLEPLLAERTRLHGGGDNVIAVAVTLLAASDAEVRLSYQIAGPSWAPAYRALLDTTTRKVRIERQALVAQATGEDWRGVKLLLSTGQPRRETAGRLPAPWRIGIAPPLPARSDAPRDRTPSSAAPAVDQAKVQSLLEVGVLDNSFATEFSVAQPIDLASSGQRVAIALGQHEDTATLVLRASPRVDAGAFMVAELAVPAGVWPPGPLQLYRDGAFVGHGRWNALDAPRLSLSFGRDELVRVEAEPERDSQGTGGFAGGRVERKMQRAYRIENRHRMPIALQVLEAAPVPVDEQVRIATRFAPQPAELAWNRQPGVAMWTLEVGAGQTARVAADYVVSYPKEARLLER
ncbi:MAG: DUF4139 domain-containing protein [Caldimonas sp.]